MKVSGARAIVECLLEQGVDIVFGYPGGQILPLYDALYDAPLRHYLTVHEQGAAHAADGYARVSGKIGVCIATSGPGATNLTTGLAAAFMDSVPIVAITGQVPTGLIGRDSFQEVDITGITMPITKHNFQVKDPAKLVTTVRQAFAIAKSGRPGPVLVDIPRDIQSAEVEYTPVKQREEEPRAGANEKLLAAAATAVNAAKQPVIIVGGGAINAEVSAEVQELAEKCGIPVVSTLMGLGAIPAEHPNFLGLSGMHGHKTANHVLNHADVMIAVGSRFSDRSTSNCSLYTKEKVLVQLDIDPAEINKNVDAHIGLAGNIKALLAVLIDKLESRRHSEWWQAIQEWQGEFSKNYPLGTLSVPWVMQQIAKQTADEQYIFAVDVGQHQMWAAQYLKIQAPRSWVTSGGLGAMGFALPAAIGAQLAAPEKRVVHLAGDGGFQMTGAELYTVAGYNLPIISVIINNRRLGMIKQLQHVFFQQRYSQCCMPFAVDFVAFAAAFGVQGVEVHSQKEFIQAFAGARQSPKPTVIVVHSKENEYVEPMLRPGASLVDYVDF